MEKKSNFLIEPHSSQGHDMNLRKSSKSNFHLRLETKDSCMTKSGYNLEGLKSKEFIPLFFSR